MSDTPLMERLGLETWYFAHFALGATQGVFVPILVPTFVLESTGEASLVGLAMALIGLGGLAAPVIGGLADKFRMHRWAQLAGLLAYALGGFVFASIGTSQIGILVGAICFGIGSATLLMINPAFIVAGGFSPDQEALRLTRLNQTMIVGTLIVGLVLSAVTSMGMSYEARFIMLSCVALAAFVITFLTNAKAAARIGTAPADATPAEVENEENTPELVPLLLSRFGILLLGIFFISTGHGVITGQFPNYMGEVFSVPTEQSTLLLSISAVVTLFTLDLIGRWMGNKGPAQVWLSAVSMKTLIMGALVAVSIMTGGSVASWVPLGLYLIFMQGIAWADMTQPALVARASTAGAGLTQGLLLFAVASAFGVGGLLSGIFADTMGFGSLSWLTGVLGALAVAFGYVGSRSKTS